ncbi:hypothetical protein ABBQ38_004684 [Trebouxia sp. C0009 RCD-2024]
MLCSNLISSLSPDVTNSPPRSPADQRSDTAPPRTSGVSSHFREDEDFESPR